MDLDSVSFILTDTFFFEGVKRGQGVFDSHPKPSIDLYKPFKGVSEREALDTFFHSLF